jgi:hypothetical protein
LLPEIYRHILDLFEDIVCGNGLKPFLQFVERAARANIFFVYYFAGRFAPTRSLAMIA